MCRHKNIYVIFPEYVIYKIMNDISLHYENYVDLETLFSLLNFF